MFIVAWEATSIESADESMLSGAICEAGDCNTPAEGERFCRAHSCAMVDGGHCSPRRPCRVCAPHLAGFNEWRTRTR